MRSGFLILSAAACLQWPVAAQDPLVGQALPRISKVASAFWQYVPRYMAQETLKQKAVTIPKKHLRIGSGAVQPQKPELKEREIVSYYAISAYRAAPEALHEFRQVVSVDGKKVTPEGAARQKLRAALQARDDWSRKSLVDDFDKAGLAIAATDFGQLVLLFTRANLEKYDFESETSGLVGADRAIVIAFHQKAGAESLRISEAGKQVKAPLSGQLWVRESDFLPLRITLNVIRRQQLDEVRDEARVDYQPGADGSVLPAAVVYRRFVNDDLVVENICEYSGWQPLSAK